MLSLWALASPDYYLGSAAESGELFAYYEADKGEGRSPDPLLRHGRWLGNFASKLGLPQGSDIRKEDFEALYYGLDPRTGDPIRKDGKSAEQQKADAKTRFDLERDFEKKQKAYLESFRTLERMTASEAASANDPEKIGERMRKTSSAVKDSMRKNNSEVQSETAEEIFSSEAIAAQQKEVERRKEVAASARKNLDTHRQKSQRPGTDMVFSAPKTVSMQLAALLAKATEEAKAEAKAIEEAHDRAVRETFKVMQREFVMTRRRDPETSRRVLEFVQGVAVAQWRHFDARPTKREDASEEEGIPQSLPDPQLHDHLNLFSPVEGADGEIYAAYTDYIRANIKALGAMYRARLSRELRQAGYATEMDDQKNGRFFKLAGISKEQQGRMSARRNEIEGKLAEGYSPRDATLASRQAKNSLNGSEMLAAWGNVFASLGVDPERVKSASLSESVAAEVRQKAQRDGLGLAATEAAIRREMEKRTPAPRTDEQIIDELLSMEAHFSLADIRQKLWEDAQFLDGLDIDLDRAVELRIRGLLQHADLLRVFDPNEPQKGGALEGMNRFGEPIFTSRKLRERENRLFGETVPALAQSSGYGVGKEEAMRIVREIEAKLTNQNGKPFKLRDFQLRAVLQAACGDGQLSVQIAGAGLGKTTSAQFTKEILAAKGRKVLGVAPTNKAASGLGRELGIVASSIDRLLLDLDSGKATLDRDTVIFVDEAGMTSFDLMEALLQRAKESGAKLILTGDPEQLPAVARGNVLRKLTEMETLANNPDALLYLGQGLGDWDYISRQKQDWAKQASAFFSKGFVAEGVREYERRGHVHTAITRGELIERIAKAYLEDSAAADKKAILGTTNDQVDSLNRLIRAKLKESGALKGSWTIRETGMEIAIGDRLVFREKVKGEKPEDGAVKNDFGTAERVRERADGSLDIAVRLDKTNADGSPMIVEINTAKHSDLGHAFALTVHKSQGMTMDSVIAAPSSFISKELFYVMASRHRERLSLFMLEQEKGTILANAALAIDKRHANDLKAVAAMPKDAQKRLAKSSIALAENIGLEKTRYEEIVLSGAARMDAALAKAQDAWASDAVRSLLKKAREATAKGASVAAKVLSGKALAEADLAQVEAASEALGSTIKIKRGKHANWVSGLEWAGRDERFIYARSEASGETLAFVAERQPPEMRAASEIAPTIASLMNSLAAKGAKLDAKARDTLLAAQGAWAKGPASVWSERDEAGRASVAVRLKKGAEGFGEIVSTLSEAGGKWSADRQAWLFPIGSSKAMEKLIALGSSRGFAAEAPLDPARARVAQAWLSIERAKSGTSPDIAEALALVEGPEDIVAHDEILAFGKALDLLDRVKTSRGGKEIEAREAKGLIVAQDEEAFYLAIPNSTRLLSIAKDGFAKAGLELPSEDIVGRRMAIRFGDDGTIFNAGIVREGPKTEAIAEAEHGVPDSSRTVGALYLSDESDLAALRRDLAFVCRERDKAHKASEIDNGAMPFVRLEGYGGNRLSGLVLAASKETVFVLHGDKVVAVSRSAPALSSLTDLDAAALVGWAHDFEIQAGRASKLRLPEESCRLVPSAAFAGKQVPMRVLRADDEHVWLADGQRRAVRLDRSNPQIAGIGHGVWAALAEGKTLIEVRFDGAGSLAAEPQNRGRRITEAHAITYPKQGERMNRDWLAKSGLER